MSNELESIFSHAVALDQNGRMKNAIYCENTFVWILNFDRTVVLRFALKSNSKPFESPIFFNANDYDSNKFYEENGHIIFESNGAGFEKKKICGIPKIENPKEVWWNLQIDGPFSSFTLHQDVINLLNEDLSHVEFKSNNNNLSIVQRDIFSGNIIQLTRKDTGLLGLNKSDDIKEDFEPFGIRTNDLIALFSFNDRIKFEINNKYPGQCRVSGTSGNLDGIISWCVYDELGEITYLKGEDHGRKKQENGTSEQKAHRKIGLKKVRKC